MFIHLELRLITMEGCKQHSYFSLKKNSTFYDFYFLYLGSVPLKSTKMKNTFIRMLAIAFLAGNLVCNKPIEDISEEPRPVTNAVTYLIEQGQHFCTPNPYVTTTDSQLNFIAEFDSSCIYTTTDPGNQDDIN